MVAVAALSAGLPGAEQRDSSTFVLADGLLFLLSRGPVRPGLAGGPTVLAALLRLLALAGHGLAATAFVAGTAALQVGQTAVELLRAPPGG